VTSPEPTPPAASGIPAGADARGGPGSVAASGTSAGNGSPAAVDAPTGPGSPAASDAVGGPDLPGTSDAPGFEALGSGDGGDDSAGAGSRRSGLRNPEAAVRGLGSGALAIEAIVLLLAIQPIRVLGGDLSGWGIGTVIALAVLCAAVAGSMRRRWAWSAGTILQVLLLAGGLLHWSLAALGLIFGAAWAYASYVRRSILG